MVRRFLATVIVAVLPWLIAPGRIQPDTKLDLTASPGAYLARSWWAWNDHAGLGELQNQAYGYLFPFGTVMGVLGEGLPAWAAQRAWWSILMVVAFVGADLLLRRLRVAGPALALVGAAAYALSPRVLTVLPQISIEVWPAAVAPWLVLAVLPAIREGATTRDRLHAAACTGLLTAALGGVNATASAVVLGLPFVWLLTAPRGRRAFAALGWWCGGVLAGALWWLAPLVVLGRFSYPFLDHIETSRMTTAVTSLTNVVRGSSHWVAYIIDRQSHPVWQSGWMQAQSTAAIVATCVAAAAGLAGLVLLRRHGAAHVARFAFVSLLVGLLAMSLGYAGTAGSPLADTVRGFLDGAGSPLRNVHKADPLVRLALVIGLVHLLARVRPRHGAVLLAALLVTPVAWWSGRGGDAWSYERIAPQWHEVASIVDDDAGDRGGSTLLLPAARTADHTWGRTSDEPLSALAESPVVFRNAAPLGPVEAWRLLDRLDLAAASGRDQPALAASYARMGIARIVVRHRLADSVGAEPDHAVQRTLNRSPGFTLVTSNDEASLWSVDAFDGVAHAYAAEPLATNGRADAIPALLAAGALGPAHALVTDAAAPDVVTDATRARSYNNGLPTHEAYGHTLTDAADTIELDGGVVRRALGARVTASSTAADPYARGHLDASTGPLSAIDGDDTTAWVSAESTTAWLTVNFDEPVDAASLDLTVLRGSGRLVPGSIEVELDGRTERVRVIDGVASLELGAPVSDVTVRFPETERRAQRGIVDLGFAGHEIPVATMVPGVDPSSTPVVLGRDDRDRAVPPRRGEEGETLAWQIDAVASGAMTAEITSERRIGDLVTREEPVDLVRGANVLSFADEPSERIRTVVLRPVGPGVVPDAEQLRTIEVNRRAPGDLELEVGAGQDAIVALTQGANDGWRAEIDGRQLEPVTVDGWRQGFRVPAGEATTLEVTFAPNRAHQTGLALGAGLVAALAVLGWITRRRAGTVDVSRLDPVVPSPGVAPAIAVVGSAVVAGALGGWIGLVAAALAWLVPRRFVPAAVFGSIACAGLALAFLGVVEQTSWGAASAQVLALVALALMVRDWARQGDPSAPAPTGAPASR